MDINYLVSLKQLINLLQEMGKLTTTFHQLKS